MKFLLFVILAGVAAEVDPNKLVLQIPEKAIDLLPLETAYIACTDEKYLYCQAQFNSFLGNTGSWTDADALEEKIGQYYQQSVRGLLTLCDANTRLIRCFGTEYNACISRTQFVKKGANTTNAFRIAGIFNTLGFQCSGGAIQATENWNCIYKTWSSQGYQSASQQCVNTFYSQNLTDYNTVCLAGQTLAKCLSLIFAGQPSPCNIPDLTWFECERVVTMFRFGGICPNIRCQVNNNFKEHLPHMPFSEAVRTYQLGTPEKAVLYGKHHHNQKP